MAATEGNGVSGLAPIRLLHQGREIAPYGMDNDDGTMTVRYADNGDIAVVPMDEITQELRYN
jgi:hypothetical protein